MEVKTACLANETAEMFARLKSENGEGVVFKQLDGPYGAERPNSGGPQRKFKVHETASFLVGKINAKRSVSRFMFAGKSQEHAGNVITRPIIQSRPRLKSSRDGISTRSGKAASSTSPLSGRVAASSPPNPPSMVAVRNLQ